VLARLNAATGAIVWQYFFENSFSNTIVSSTLARKTLVDCVNEVIVAHRGSGDQRPIYVRIVADFTTGTVSTTTPPATYIDSSSTLATSTRAYGQFIIDQDLTVFLLLKSK
jgi:outer membrane protein assembly factor BamB